eukprot:5724965-Amphidinium_carterae.2
MQVQAQDEPAVQQDQGNPQVAPGDGNVPDDVDAEVDMRDVTQIRICRRQWQQTEEWIEHPLTRTQVKTHSVRKVHRNETMVFIARSSTAPKICLRHSMKVTGMSSHGPEWRGKG